jgi:hypothetical protein
MSALCWGSRGVVGGGGGGPSPPSGPRGFILTDPYTVPAGAVDGDIGYWEGSGRVLTTLTRPGGSDIQLWLPGDVAAGTPTVRAWIGGTEATSAWTSQGGAAAGAGTITPNVSSSGFTRFSSTGASQNALMQVDAAWGPSAGTRVYIVCLMRGASTAGSTDNALLFPYWFRHTVAADEIIITQRGSTGVVHARDASIGINVIGGASNAILRNGGSVWAGLATGGEIVEAVDSGQTGGCRVMRDGFVYLHSRRSAAGAVSNFLLCGVLHGSGATGTSDLDVRDWHWITY